ncbi:MAG TPA: AraC family transcriptional regulator [Kofleriaceae bacterium]|nr:AraC family transcriptional regulator [Kofleriaceae bacterium]
MAARRRDAPPIDDLLGHVLEGSRLRGQVFCESVARAPWALRFPARAEPAFHLVTAGSAVLLVDGKAHPLAQGDLVLLPRGAAHVMADQARTRPIELAAWLASGAPALGGANGRETRVLCGVYQLEGLGAHHPVLRLLPSWLILPAARTRADGDLAATLTAIAREHERSARGASVIVARLLEVLFVQVIRAWAAEQPIGGAGWIGALDDALLARALSVMHAELARAWDVATLARVCATSRATLARRFVARVGEPPLAYLTRARMHEAARALRSSDAGLSEVAAGVGYQSEFAFNRAFRRVFGLPPGAYRGTPSTSARRD